VAREEDAIGVFHAEYTPIIRRVLLRRHAAELADDSLQLVLERLLLAPAGAAPKLAEYRGIAALRSWVATVAARTLAMMRRSAERRREETLGDDPLLDAPGADPELLYLKEHCRAELELAIVAALGQLGARERTLLRLHLGERMSIDQLGHMYAVNRATAARWVAAARRAVVESARAELGQKLGISASDCQSLMALVQSQFHLSLVRRLL
jgi:RNA polymerase sigma-70 factor (ECF subfamily)